VSFPSLEALAIEVAECRKCRLADTRKSVVFGEGNPEANLMVIGEAPGADEDASGRPFVGRSGQLLTKILQAVEFSREEVFIANMSSAASREPQPFARRNYLLHAVAGETAGNHQSEGHSPARQSCRQHHIQ